MNFRYFLVFFLLLPTILFSQYSTNNNVDGSMSIYIRGTIGVDPEFENLNSLLKQLSQNVTKELINNQYTVKDEKITFDTNDNIEISLKLVKSNNTYDRFIEVRYSAIFTSDIYLINGNKTDNPKGDAINNFRFNRTPQLVSDASTYKIVSKEIESNPLKGINNANPNRIYNLQLFADYINVPSGIEYLHLHDKIKNGGTCFTNIDYKNLAKQDGMSSVLPNFIERNVGSKQESVPLPEIEKPSNNQSKSTTSASQNDKSNSSIKSESVSTKQNKNTVTAKYYPCGLEIKQEGNTIVGNLKYIPIEFINHSKKSIDNIDFTINYYNVYGEILDIKSEKWETGIFTDPFKPKTKITYRLLNYISSTETAKKYTFRVNRVHYTDDNACVY